MLQVHHVFFVAAMEPNVVSKPGAIAFLMSARRVINEKEI